MKTKHTAILIDDEAATLKTLEAKILKHCPEIAIIDKFQKPELALKALLVAQPDIIFLDIEMPRMNGFELLAALGEVTAQVIFVTAYSAYALDALKQSAIDYVMKPIDNEDLITAVLKAQQAVAQSQENDQTTKLVEVLTKTLSTNDKLIIPTSKGVSFIPENEIKHLEGYEGYTRIHLEDAQMIMSSYNLGKFEKMVSSRFFKCHKSHIVNLEKVRSFENEGYIVLENDYRIPISRANRKIFLELFSK